MTSTGGEALSQWIKIAGDGRVADGDYDLDFFWLTAAEVEVFSIDRQRGPMLGTAWHAYQSFAGPIPSEPLRDEWYSMIAAAQAEWPDFPRPWWELENWLLFALTFADIPVREASQWWHRVWTYMDRTGALDEDHWRDEAVRITKHKRP